MPHDALFSPLKMGALALPNRILMAPLTRCRADDDHVPGPLMAEYYAQRATAGLIVAEATMAIAGNSAFWREPGIYAGAHIAGWRVVTEAVHDKGGRIALQLWHGGRACHPLLNNGATPVAPSAEAIVGSKVLTPQGMQPYVTPRALRDAEIPEIVSGFAQAARNAKVAGFDAVEVHGANGYLLDEFLRDGANRRSGPYGGPIENRARLLLEALEAVIGVWGADRVGVRLSPLNSYNDMSDSDPVGLTAWLAARLDHYGIAYLHMMRGDFAGPAALDVMTPARAGFRGVLIGNMGYDAAEADAAIREGKLDAVAFGVPFLANPDLPARFKADAPLNRPRPASFYTPGAEGYTDYPTMTG
jgi:N-ethylmaleimide reductase